MITNASLRSILKHLIIPLKQLGNIQRYKKYDYKVTIILQQSIQIKNKHHFQTVMHFLQQVTCRTRFEVII